MNDEVKQSTTTTEDDAVCPLCSCADWDWSTVWVDNIETTAKFCENCGYAYGGDL